MKLSLNFLEMNILNVLGKMRKYLSMISIMMIWNQQILKSINFHIKLVQKLKIL
jgi:hypothetical protein